MNNIGKWISLVFFFFFELWVWRKVEDMYIGYHGYDGWGIYTDLIWAYAVFYLALLFFRFVFEDEYCDWNF